MHQIVAHVLTSPSLPRRPSRDKTHRTRARDLISSTKEMLEAVAPTDVLLEELESLEPMMDALTDYTELLSSCTAVQ